MSAMHQCPGRSGGAQEHSTSESEWSSLRGAHLRNGGERGFQAVQVEAAQAAVTLQQVYHLLASPFFRLVAHLTHLQHLSIILERQAPTFDTLAVS